MIGFLSIFYSISIFVLLVGLYLVYRVFVKPYRLLQFYKKQGIKTSYFPMIGDVKDMYEDIDKHGDFYYKAKQKIFETPKPKAWATNIGDTALLILKDHELVKTYYLNHDRYYMKFQPIITLLKSLVGDGVLLADGPIWKRHRKLVSVAFNYEILKEMIPEVVSIADEYLDKLKKKNLNKVDILTEVQLITGEIVGRIFFGENFNEYEINGQSIVQCLPELLAAVSEENLQFHTMLLPERLIKMGILPYHRQLLKRVKEFRDKIKAIARQKMEEIASGKKNDGRKLKRVNLLELFSKQKEDEENFTDEELVDEFITFFLAGTDTTGHLLTMASYHLLKNPQYKDKVFKEVNNLFSDLSSVSIETLNKMDFVTAFMKETLRVTPIGGSLFARVATEDHELGPYIVKKGTAINLSFLSNYYDPEYYQEPETFLPERWLEEGSKTKKSVSENPFIYTPFSAATRNCIGQHLAMNEARIIFSLFLRKFDYLLSDENYKLKMTERFLYEPYEPIFYNLKPKA